MKVIVESRSGKTTDLSVSETQCVIDKNVTVLPGSYLAREAQGVNPGRNRVRVALVSTLDECAESANRMHDFILKL